MNRFLNSLYPLALAAGLAGIAGAGLAASRHHPVALAMTLVIAAFFMLGVLELSAFRRASGELAAALATPADDGWLARVPAALRAAVQQRLEGLRVALPGLALAPALSGLLVLLGMLGTFIGLVITLGGTAQAVSATADLAALRVALGAPVQGLGLAFSASVAGVAGSAMLGLMVALARRQRMAVAGQLDAALLGPLQVLTATHRRALTQQASDAAGAEAAQQRQRELVAQLQQFAQQMADQLAAQNARHEDARKAEQAKFHDETRTAYQALAASVDTTLRSSLAESARLAGAAIQPAAEAAMAGIAREAAALHERVAGQVAGQLGALTTRFDSGLAQITQHSAAAAAAQADGLAQQREAALRLLADTGQATQDAVQRLGERWATEAQTLLAALGETASRQQAAQADADGARAAALQAQLDALAEQRAAAQQAAAQATERFAAQTQDLLDRLTASQAAQLAAQAELDAQRRNEARAEAQTLAAQRAASEALFATQREAAEQAAATSSERTQHALAELTAGFAAQTQAAVAALADAHQRLQSAHAAHDAERLATWRTELQAAGAAQLAQQQQLADGLLSHTRDLVAQAGTHAQTTLNEAGELLKAAGEAPRAAVEVVAALREQLAQSQAQDRAALAERAELMQTVATLLASLQQAAGEQRAAIDALVGRASSQVDALVGNSATQLEALGERFATQADTTGQALADAAVQLSASAAEMGSLGEGFGAAVEQFQGSNAQLVQHLAALEERLAGAMTRSDEQLGYYVAQAREVIDLCLGSQKQVLDALHGAAAHG
jgi:hypothetical protein